MKKQYSVPTLTTHGSVEAITEFSGRTDLNDFLFFNGSSSPVNNPSTGSPSTGDGSSDSTLNPDGSLTQRRTLQGR